ncbi:MAG: group II intron reverse transcriptase/maturase [Candidatus Izemoplasmatales bacterium]|nr:group II intron reverse transcriptase/maturase [Candidatus Izemoplasmatales bacterium]
MTKEFNNIREQSKRFKTVEGCMHCVNMERLKEEHKAQDFRKAVGVDGVTKETYGNDLENNLKRLVGDMKSFSYKPKPVRRAYIPKTDGKERALGIPSYEDKLVQGVMRRVLDEVYESRFMDFSYGFRRNKRAHQAVSRINNLMMRKKLNYVVDADIKGFFDNVNHEWLIKFLENDIEDKRFIRYIKRFLIAGVMKDGQYIESDKGTPQGGLISPILANVYLHYVLDLWFEKRIKKNYRGQAEMVRYADDFVCMFEYEKEARRFYRELKERLAKFDLELAEGKSKIIPFGRFAQANYNSKETFDFLGFTFINGETRTNKYRLVIQTSKKKLKQKKENVKEWLKTQTGENVLDIIKRLNKKIIGHYNYYGISGNFKGLNKFYFFIRTALYNMLTRRSQRSYLNWERYFKLLEKHPIVKPRLYVNIW